jgi:hypothetical protein
MRLALVLCLATLPAAACASQSEFRCDASTFDSWLAKSPGELRSLPTLPEERIAAVTQDVGGAIARLRDRDSVMLTDSEAGVLTGGAAAPPAGAGGGPPLRPWLVRAVFPVSSPHLDAAWEGDGLVVFADGLGCAPFVKHPVVVWLDKAPARVIVVATAAL